MMSGDNTKSFAGNVAVHAVAGGIGSVLGGGKFENGAITGSFGYLFNRCLQESCFGKNNFLVRGWAEEKASLEGWKIVDDMAPGDSISFRSRGGKILIETSAMGGPLPTVHFKYTVWTEPINWDGSRAPRLYSEESNTPIEYSSGFLGGMAGGVATNQIIIEASTASLWHRWVIKFPVVQSTHDNSAFQTINVYQPKDQGRAQ